MKLNEEQYNELVNKLACEIVEDGFGKEASENSIEYAIEAKKAELFEKEASEHNDLEMAEKAAAVYEYALRKIAACEEYYADGVVGQEACLELLKEAGVLTEDGFNKEAAESSHEMSAVTSKIASYYEESDAKIVAAQEKYAEAVEEANSALEVLAELGYELN